MSAESPATPPHTMTSTVMDVTPDAPESINRGRPAFVPLTPSQVEELTSQLTAFLEAPTDTLGPIDTIIQELVATGSSSLAWALLQPLLLILLDRVIQGFGENLAEVEVIDGETFQVRLARVQASISGFQEPPFTIQRICELLSQPKRHYRNLNKFFMAFSKMVNGITRTCTNEEFSDDEAMDEGDYPDVAEASGFQFQMPATGMEFAAASRFPGAALERKSESRPATPRTISDREELEFTYSGTLNMGLDQQPPAKHQKTEDADDTSGS